MAWAHKSAPQLAMLFGASACSLPRVLSGIGATHRISALDWVSRTLGFRRCPTLSECSPSSPPAPRRWLKHIFAGLTNPRGWLELVRSWRQSRRGRSRKSCPHWRERTGWSPRWKRHSRPAASISCSISWSQPSPPAGSAQYPSNRRSGLRVLPLIASFTPLRYPIYRRGLASVVGTGRAVRPRVWPCSPLLRP
jgi:hypothetical protein